jgi:hypothetical protein
LGREVQSFLFLYECSTLSKPQWPHQTISSLNPVLSRFYRGFIMQALLMKSLVISDQLNLSVHLFFEEVKDGDESFKPLIM